MQNSIGGHEFLAILGNIVPTRERLLPPVQRPGVDGTGIRKAGNKGSLFTLISQVDSATIDSARAKAELYLEQIDADPVVLIISDYNFSTQDNWKVKVYDVRVRRIHGIVQATGGINDPSGAFLECEWNLMAIAN